MCVVGGGLVGSLLAWRLSQCSDAAIDLLLGSGSGSDATQASGGVVRAYEPLPAQRALAAASLSELLASQLLRRWADYRQTGSVYLRDTEDLLAAEVAELDREFPGSVDLLPVSAALGSTDGCEYWAGPAAGRAVVERLAGYISPAGLRQAVLADLAGRPRIAIETTELAAVTVAATATGVTCRTADGSQREYDVIVLAAGPWTPELLRSNGLPAGGYRTKSIQYSIYSADGWRPPPFVDEFSGLYCKPTADGGMLLGVPTDEWDVPPGRSPVTPRWHDRAAALAKASFPQLRLGALRTQLSAADCYGDPPVLSLRPVLDGNPGLFTFTGGSGGSAKTVLAASLRAAATLTGAGAGENDQAGVGQTRPG
jgi:glycine/D-amino acid oxidase-like deaminating enzyme